MGRQGAWQAMEQGSKEMELWRVPDGPDVSHGRPGPTWLVRKDYQLNRKQRSPSGRRVGLRLRVRTCRSSFPGSF